MTTFKKIFFLMLCMSFLHSDTFQLPHSKVSPQIQNKKIDKKTEKEIISIGYGSTEKEALHNAFNSAIESFVGIIVDSETVSKNNRIIKDNILTGSNGFIKRYDKIYTKRDKGVVEVKIKAIVKSQKVYNTMRDLNIKTVSEATLSNTKNIYAKITSNSKSKHDIEKILKKEINDLISADSINDMIKVKIVESKIYDVDELPSYFQKRWYVQEIKKNKVPIEIFYKIEFDYDLYAKKIKKLENIFKNLGAKVTRNTTSLYSHKGYLYLKNGQKIENTNFGIIRKNSCGYVLDIWEFPSSWKDIFPFGIKYGSRNRYIKTGGFYDIFTLRGKFQTKKKSLLPFSNQNKKNGITLFLRAKEGDKQRQNIYLDFLIDTITGYIQEEYIYTGNYWREGAQKNVLKIIHPILFYTSYKIRENPILSTLQWVKLESLPEIKNITMEIIKRKK